jgi:hypothetical protein
VYVFAAVLVEPDDLEPDDVDPEDVDPEDVDPDERALADAEGVAASLEPSSDVPAATEPTPSSPVAPIGGAAAWEFVLV